MKRIQRAFKDFPIARKINFTILLTCGGALVIAAVAIFVVQLLTFQHTFKRDLEGTGRMLGQTATAAITFKEKSSATEILAAVSAKPCIFRASINLPDGSEFAAYERAKVSLGPDVLKTDGVCSAGPFLVLNQAVVLAGERIATLHLVCDYQTQYRRSLWLYAAILGGVLLASALFALALSNRLQRLISSPILSLADTARAVAEKKDYSLRAPVGSRDEVGELSAAFNQMLSQLGQETAARRQSEVEKETILETAQVGIVIIERDSHRLRYVNQTAQTLAGRSREGLLGQCCHSVICPAQEGRCPVTDLNQTVDHSERVLVHADGTKIPILKSVAPITYDGRPCLIESFVDLSERKKAEHALEKLNKDLVLASRQAGMAEVATGVLHNVGNVLNSVNVSVNLVHDQLGRSSVSMVTKLATLLQTHRANLGEFLTVNPKGRLVPDYLSQLDATLQEERSEMVAEMRGLLHNIEHIKEIVAMQQSYATVSGVTEFIPATSLMEDAIRLNEAVFVRHGISIERDFQEVPPVRVDRHKTLQILINLLRNAMHALDATDRSDKVLTLSIAKGESERVKVLVRDNGVGIKPENIIRIFSYGFTTKKQGHGFGLHSGANAAKEMGGSLQAFSEGPGKGATFVLELPTATPGPAGPKSARQDKPGETVPARSECCSPEEVSI